MAAFLLFAAAPAQVTAATDSCAGRNVRSLGGPHAVSQKPLRNLADLQARLPALEAGMREMIATDDSLGAGVADALFTAIRDGGAIRERQLGRQESIEWMVYRPKRGELATIAPPCLDLRRDYDAFEITVEVPEPMPVPPDDAVCKLSATRNCERRNPTITLDTTGSSANARVEHAGSAVAGAGARGSVADATPYSQDETFIVRADGSPPEPHTVRVYRFLIPKVCSNLAYLGEAPRKVLAAAGPPQSCEESVTVAQCSPWAEVAVDPQAVEVHDPATITTAGGWHDGLARLELLCPSQDEPIALEVGGSTAYTPDRTCCGHDGYQIRFETRNAAGEVAEATTPFAVRPHDWTVRPSLVYYAPTGSSQRRDVELLWDRQGREEFEVDEGYGIAVAFERRMNEHWGIELASIFGRAETSYELTVAGDTGEDDHNANFYAFTVGPNLHLLDCCRVDLFAGVFAGYGGLADPNYRVFDHLFQAAFDGEFVWGAHLGLDVPFSPASDWGFHGGLRYTDLSQTTDAGTIAVDPLLVEVGLSYKF